MAQDPVVGTDLPSGSKITLSVSKGPQAVQVPDVTGTTQADAQALLSDAGYRTAVHERPVTDPGEDGLVLSQRPEGGQLRKKGTLVTITVGKLKSQGSETVPTTTAATTTAATTTTATTTAAAPTLTPTPPATPPATP